MNPMEVYTVEVPDVLELHASGVKVGILTNKNNTVYVSDIKQRVFMPDLIAGVQNYARRINKDIEYCIFDPEYDRFEFKLKDPAPNPRLDVHPLPRVIKDNPQA